MEREIKKNLFILSVLIIFLVISFSYGLPWIKSKANLEDEYHILAFNLRYLPIEVVKANLNIDYCDKINIVSSVTFEFVNEKEMDSVVINFSPSDLVIRGKLWQTSDTHGQDNLRYMVQSNLSVTQSKGGVLLKTKSKIKKGKMNMVTLDFQPDFEPNGKIELKNSGQLINNTEIKLIINTDKYECADLCFESNLEKSRKRNDKEPSCFDFVAEGKNKDKGVVSIKTRNKSWANFWLLLFAINASLITYMIILGLNGVIIKQNKDNKKPKVKTRKSKRH